MTDIQEANDAIAWTARLFLADGFIKGLYRNDLSAQHGIGREFPKYYVKRCREAQKYLPLDEEFDRYAADVNDRQEQVYDIGRDYATNWEPDDGGDVA